MGLGTLVPLLTAGLLACAPEGEPASGETVWVTDVEAGELRHFDAATGEDLGTVLSINEVPEVVGGRGFQPAALAWWQDELVVTNFASGEVFAVDPEQGDLRHLWYDWDPDVPKVEEPVALAPLDDGLAVLGNDTRNVVWMDPNDANEASEVLDDPVRYGHGLVRWRDELIVATSPFQRELGLLQRFDASTGAPRGDFGFYGELQDATGVTLGPDDLLYVTDWWAGEVARFDPVDGTRVDTWAEGLDRPVASAFAGDGALLVITRNELLRVDQDGVHVLTDDLVFGRGLAVGTRDCAH